MTDTPEIIDAAFPFHGPCQWCGNPDGRHLLFDIIRHRAPDTAHKYIVELIRQHWDIEGQTWKP